MENLQEPNKPVVCNVDYIRVPMKCLLPDGSKRNGSTSLRAYIKMLIKKEIAEQVEKALMKIASRE